jgi:putative two-component system response regulator
MIVDDEPINLRVVRKYLELAGYEQFILATDPKTVAGLLHREQPDVLLLDIMMPEVSGLELLEYIKADETLAQLPVLILTAVDDRETKLRALSLGATDFLTKPVDPTELVPRVRNALVLKAHQDHLRNYARELECEVARRTAELEDSRLQVIRCLARAAEYRDNETGRHVMRVGRYVGIIARQMRIPDADAKLMELAALLHDVGKIGVTDEILLKPGKLDPHEYERVQKHCGFGKRIFEPLGAGEWHAFAAHTTIGANIVEAGETPLLALAGRIALTHHERWDGTGYPLGLAGADIPLEGRITSVADVFDALSSRRPYKPAFPLDRCFAILEEERGRAFDPRVLDAFLACRHEIVAIQLQYADVE